MHSYVRSTFLKIHIRGDNHDSRNTLRPYSHHHLAGSAGAVSHNARSALTAGGAVKLDLYEGMPHVFQAVPNLPESKLALKKVAAFLEHYQNRQVGGLFVLI
jgi:acetyl esterase/lipase